MIYKTVGLPVQNFVKYPQGVGSCILSTEIFLSVSACWAEVHAGIIIVNVIWLFISKVKGERDLFCNFKIFSVFRVVFDDFDYYYRKLAESMKWIRSRSWVNKLLTEESTDYIKSEFI